MHNINYSELVADYYKYICKTNYNRTILNHDTQYVFIALKFIDRNIILNNIRNVSEYLGETCLEGCCEARIKPIMWPSLGNLYYMFNQVCM